MCVSMKHGSPRGQFGRTTFGNVKFGANICCHLISRNCFRSFINWIAKKKDICHLTFQQIFESFINSVEEIFQAIHFSKLAALWKPFIARQLARQTKLFLIFLLFYPSHCSNNVCLFSKQTQFSEKH